MAIKSNKLTLYIKINILMLNEKEIWRKICSTCYQLYKYENT